MYSEILITGGSGFVGASLGLALKRRWPSIRVTALDNLHRRGSELNLPRLRAAGIEFVHGDIRSPEDLRAAGRPDLILECSAEPSAQAGYGGSPEYLIGTNLVGCFHCLELARQLPADIIFLSTSRVYPFGALNGLCYREEPTRFALCGEQPAEGASARGIAEEFPLEGARSLYGMTKLAGELMIAEYAAAYGIRYVINRCGLIAGPWQMGKTDQGVVALWAAAHYFRLPLAYIGFGGSGKQVRDVIHIEDVCDLVLDQLERPDRYQGGVFNVGGGLGNSVSLVELTRLCEQVTGNRTAIGSVPQDRPADVRAYVSDCRRIGARTGWRPRRDVSSVIADLVSWMRAEEGAVRAVFVSR